MTISKGAAGFYNVEEQTTPIALDIAGAFPRNISGVLWRTGPGTYSVPTKGGKTFEISHWFDGLAQHHRFEIQPATNEHDKPKVLYTSKNAAQPDAEHIGKHGSIDAITFGQQDPCKRVYRRFFQMFTPTLKEFSNVNVTLTPDMPLPGAPVGPLSNGQPVNLVAKTDANALARLDPETLEVLEYTDYSKTYGIPGQISAAHTCRDGGYMFQYSLELGPRPTYRVFCIDEAAQECTVLATIRDAPPAYIHSFMLTQKYVVFCVWQADFAYLGLSILWNRSIAGAFKPPNPKREAIFYLIDRHVGGKGVVARLTAPTFFCFHTINAYDQNDEVILDLSAHKDHSICKFFAVENLRSVEALRTLPANSFHRYRLSAAKPSGVAELLYEIPMGIDLPVCNPTLFHRKHRYCYGVHRSQEGLEAGLFLDSIAKVDTETRKMTFWKGKDEVPGEPIFVTREGATAEDDGVLLTVVYDVARGGSALVALDASTMTELGRACHSRAIPYGFHGAFRHKIQ